MSPARVGIALPLLLLLAVPLLRAAQEEPLVAGSEGVPVPKKTKHVQPVYPPEALAQGVRGIVILDIVVDTHGRVASTTIIRSVPGLDEAAVAAARQWQYEPVKVGGKPVSVRLTVPITFSLQLPQLIRSEGIPELRQGVVPAFPETTSGSALAVAAVTLESDGRIGAARIMEGSEPWAGALLAALKTWRFSAPPEDAVLSFRVEAQFVAGKGNEARHVELRATGLQKADLLGAAEPTQSASATPASSPASMPPGAPAGPPKAGPTATPAETPTAPAAQKPASPAAPQPVAPSPAGPAPTAGTSATATPPAPPAAVPPAGQAAAPPAAAPAAASASAKPAAPGAGTSTPPPPIEVITVPPPALPPENGVSAIRDVTLEPGVPDLARGRRPTPPPLARIAGATGSVEVAFSVNAAGASSVRTVTGPDLLKKAASEAVASWVFRRARADRAHLIAVFTYGEDKASATVRPEPAEATPPPATSAAPETPAPPGAPATTNTGQPPPTRQP